MSDYKLVPVEPTPEMVSAAEDAYMPFGDMELALRMAILAAPAVQGEPVGWQFYKGGKWWHGNDCIKGHRKNTEEAGYLTRDVYAAPQLAEQQPEAVREGAPYDDPAFSALCREHEVYGTAAAAQCAVFWEAGKRAAEQQPAQDVAKLQRKLEASFRREERLEAEVRELKREKFKKFRGEECWIWAGDASDKLETLMCPVVISPSDLLEIISRAESAPDVAGLDESPIDVIYTDGCGAGRRSPADCRYGISYVTVADTVYWPLSADDAQRLRSAECGRGDFTGPANECPEVSALVEALELARRTLAMAALEGEVTRRIDTALSARRKQETSNDNQ